MGTPAAEVLRTRIADMRAATYLGDLPAGRPEVLDGDTPQLRFVLADGWLLLIRVGHKVVPRTDLGALEMERVRRALVQEIER